MSTRTVEAGPITGTIVGLIFLVVGYFVAFTFGKPILDNAKASNDWPKVVGKINRSSVVTSRSRDKTHYSFDVVYDYKVEGEGYTSSNVYFGGEVSSSSSSSAYKVKNRYPKGSSVDVYYDPQEPSNAVLEPGAHWQSYIIYAGGWMFLLVGGLVAGSSIFKMLLVGAVVVSAATSALGNSGNQGSTPMPRPSSGGSPRPDLRDLDYDDEDDGFGV